MTELKGETAIFPYLSLEKVGDLLYLDGYGALTTVFKDEKTGAIVLAFEADINETYQDWLIFRQYRRLFFSVTIQTLSEYLNGTLPDLGLIRRAVNEDYYSVETSVCLENGKETTEIQNVLKVRLQDLPTEYLPELDVFYENCPDEAKIIAYFELYIHKYKGYAGRIVDISNCGFTELPPEIGNITDLTVLHLCDNKLANFPPEIGNLTELTDLYASRNQLSELSPKIGNLTQLRYLLLSQNNLMKLPPEIGNLTRLHYLGLSQNHLTELPPEIGNLTQLSHLDLSRNKLTRLPLEMIALKNNLELLDISYNPICQNEELLAYYVKFLPHTRIDFRPF